MKVALVCDWLTGIGGAEKVLLELHKIYPKAPIYTSQYDANSIDWFEHADVRTTWLQKLPSSLKKFLPLLRAFAFSRLDLSEYDLVISSSGAEAKYIKTGPKTIHICYCHSPTHYYWIRRNEYLDKPGFPRGLNWIARLGFKILYSPLKRWDRQAAKGPDYIIANSTYTQENIRKYYKRESTVIFPPVDVDKFNVSGRPKLRHGFVIAGRQSPYKRFDLAIEACNELKVPLVVIGDGPEHKNLEKMADRNITFLTDVNDYDLANHFQTALGFIMPNIDDFGIVAVEALAAGTPVIAYDKGGSEDYLLNNQNGIYFDRQTRKNLIIALNQCLNKRWNYAAISSSADKFSTAEFKKNIKAYIAKQLSSK